MTTSFFGLNNHDNSLSFCRALEALMRGHCLEFYIAGEPLTSTPVRPKSAKPQYKCPYSFEEQVEILRRLHPDVDSAGESEPLLAALKTWRESSMKAMSFTGTLSQFGGWFKEAMAVACISRRCYRVVRSIFVGRKMAHLKINRGLFKQLPGMKDEFLSFKLLQKLDHGDIGVVDFNKELMNEKVSARQVRDQHAAVPDVELVLAENRRLCEEVAGLRERCAYLEERLKTVESQSIEARDEVSVYDFMEEPSAPVVTTRPQRQKPVYRVAFEGRDSEESLDDSLEDPHYNPTNGSEDSEDEDYISPVPSDQFQVTNQDLSLSDVGEDNDRSLLNKGFVVIDELRSWDPLQPTVSLPMIPLCEEKVCEVFTENRTEHENDVTLTRKMRSRTKSSVFAVGQRVSALFRYAGRDAAQEWCPAVIQSVILNGMRYSIKFDDGVVRIVKGTDIKLS